MPLSLRQVEGLLFERGDRRLHAILYDYSGGFSWYPFGPDDRLQHDIAGTLGNGARGYIVGTYDKDAGANNQRLYLNGARVAQMSDIQPLDLNSNPLGIGRHVSGIADPFNGPYRRVPHRARPIPGMRLSATPRLLVVCRTEAVPVAVSKVRRKGKQQIGLRWLGAISGSNG